MKSTRLINLMLLSVMVLAGCKSEKKEAVTPEEAKAVAKEAYIFGFPIVMNYKTMYAYTLDRNSTEYKGDFNQLGCTARAYTPEDKAIVTPNSDTPYCMGWANISQDPVVISVPEMESDRFYHIQLIDMYTHNFGYIGTLTTGNEAGKFLVASKEWNGNLPEGIKDVLRCETDYFFMLNRTQLFGPDDLERISEIQMEYVVQTLSSYNGQTEKVTELPKIPEWKEGDQFTAAIFSYLDPWLQQLEPAEDDKEIFNRFKKLGLSSGKFDLNAFDSEVKMALEDGVKAAIDEMNTFISEHADPLASARIFGTRSFLKTSARENYNLDRADMIRLVGAQTGLYGNSGTEAIYPAYFTDSKGAQLDASDKTYTLTFEAGSLPPVKAFWSLTMYDGKTQLLIKNALDRYLLNSTMMDEFVKNSDGSLSFYIQKDSPGEELESNWLPAPDGPFYCILRLYGPEPQILEGQWKVPEMMRN